MRTKFVAEVSSNHNQDIERCYRFIDTAKEVGCDAVKFQLFKLNKLFHHSAIERFSQIAERVKWELPIEYLPRLAQRCQSVGVEFSCTPFYLEAVDELYPYVAFYKLASYELLWDAMLMRTAKMGKPVVLSTGMATGAEVDRAVSVLRQAGCTNLTLLHCVSGYPAPMSECNLNVMDTMTNRYSVSVGWSDHSVNSNVIYQAALRHHASMIEFHLDLDGKGDEFHIGHCWLPQQIAPIIKGVGCSELIDGCGDKLPTSAERDDCNWRTDPSDGLRPMLTKRLELSK
jgi:sialic acid synthase SpsE